MSVGLMTESKNQMTYATKNIVQYYTQLKALQPAEQLLFDRLRSQLPQLRMLDIGVGAGRTTQHFQPVVAEYVGIDDSAEMIQACRDRFPQVSPETFQVCDARDMGCFDDHYFDLILFSFNGIDYVSHYDRLRVLKEISRIGKPGATFIFSSHNLQGFDRIFDFKSQCSFNPIATYTNLVMLTILRFLNRPLTPTQLKALPYAILKDESHNFRLNTYYIRPQEQLTQLTPDFTDIEVYSWRSDRALVTEADRSANTDLWLYYLCRIGAC
jgi:ubiquinone/menaquinone biosynthesis C-methylase UbiE